MISGMHAVPMDYAAYHRTTESLIGNIKFCPPSKSRFLGQKHVDENMLFETI